MHTNGKVMTADLMELIVAEEEYDTGPTTTEQILSEILAGVMDLERVSADSHFFDDLGADSMVMARFCARIRKQSDRPRVSIKMVYEHSTVSSLAMALSGNAPSVVTPTDAAPASMAPMAPMVPVVPVATAPVATEPAEPTPADSTPADSTPADSTPADSTPAVSMPDDTTSDDTTPEVPEAAEPMNTTEQILSGVLTEIMSVESISTHSHFFDDLGADSMVMARFCARIRKQGNLPRVSIKQVYAHPTIGSLAASLIEASPSATPVDKPVETAKEEKGTQEGAKEKTATKETSTKETSTKEAATKEAATKETTTEETATVRSMREVLAEIMDVENISTDSHFFDDLGADSMVMARFCARIRKRDDLPAVSIKQVYAHPTIGSLAAALTDASPSAVSMDKSLAEATNETSAEPDRAPAPAPVPAAAVAAAPAVVNSATPVVAQTPHQAACELEEPIGTPMYHLCGALQILTIFGYLLAITTLLERSYQWVSVGTTWSEIFIRSLLIVNGLLIFWLIMPILAKRALIGRWKPQRIRIWSLAYYRFWLVRFLLRLNPMNAFVGSPLYNVYLRALGAKIGKGVVIMSNKVPVCTDLLTIGDNAFIRKDSHFSCYHAHDGLIRTGSVTIGANAYVGEMTVLDIDTSIGDGAQIGHSSSLHAGQSIPDGEHRYGSPAEERTDVDYRGVETTYVDPLRKTAYTAVQLFNTFITVSIVYGIFAILLPTIAELEYFTVLEKPLSPWVFLGESVLITVVYYFGAILLGLVFVVTVPRILNLILKPDTAYPLYGFRYWAHQNIARITNVKFYLQFFGDSAYIVYYLRWLGYDIAEPIVQTGSNFGTAVKHDNPFLVSIGSGTVIADGLSSINADYSSTSFQVSQVTIGSDNFLGNNIGYPARGKTGDNCLLATKVAVPMEGEVREGVGLLGSPSFNIPRSVQRDLELDHPESDVELVHKLTTKTEHNLVTMGLFLVIRWFAFFISFMFQVVAANLYPIVGISAFATSLLLTLILMPFYSILVERATTQFRDLEPQQCSIYEPYFWFHERYWKLSMQPSQLALFDGMPLKSFAWRLLGVKMGKRVFDDGAAIVEKTMVSIGDNCTLNAGAIIQPHSQEDGGFKSDYISIGAGCTLGVGAFVHYGVKMGDNAQLEAHSFLMKGEEVPANTQWGDNPAMELQEISPEKIVEAAVPSQLAGGIRIAANEAAQPRKLQPRKLQNRELQGRELQGRELQGRELQNRELQGRIKRAANLLPSIFHRTANNNQMASVNDRNVMGRGQVASPVAGPVASIQVARGVDRNRMARVGGKHRSAPASPPRSSITAPAYLVNVSGETHIPSRFAIEGRKEVRIGRKSLYCQHVINHPKVSRVHASITPENGAFYIKDEGSTGGTSVNAQELGETGRRRLENNDIVHFNGVMYRFEITAPRVGRVNAPKYANRIKQVA